MTKAKQNELRKALLQKQAELADTNKSRDEFAVVSTSEEMDRIQQTSERESAIDKMERNSSRMAEVRAALNRLEAGALGICTGCEEEINPRRLAAVPWARYCLACQEAEDRERSGAHGGDALFEALA